MEELRRERNAGASQGCDEPALAQAERGGRVSGTKEREAAMVPAFSESLPTVENFSDGWLTRTTFSPSSAAAGSVDAAMPAMITPSI
jgi:hypothetical protein